MKVFALIFTMFIGFLTTVAPLWHNFSPDCATEYCDDENSDTSQPCDEPCNPFENCDCSLGFVHSVLTHDSQLLLNCENPLSANMKSPLLQNHFDIFHPPKQA